MARSRFLTVLRIALLTVLALGVPIDSPGHSVAADATPVPSELQKAITAAIEKGEKWVRAQRAGDGMFGSIILNGGEFHQIGLASLASLSLLGPGASKADPGFQATLKAIKQRDDVEKSSGARTTYGTGLLLMFLTELYRPEPEPVKAPGRYVKATPNPCNLPKDMAEWVQDFATWLVDKQLDDGLWRYPTTPPGDLSNTHYALLGLRAARDCGSKVPLSCFIKALERMQAAQKTDGPKVSRAVADATKPGGFDLLDAGDRARGFGYHGRSDERDLTTGAMTTAGIAVMAICRDSLMKPERFSTYGDNLDREIQQRIQDGFAWLDKNFAVNKNPPSGAPAWHYYYLWGLEQACGLTGRGTIGTRDWYSEGAKYLVEHQKPDGSWSTGAIGEREMTPSDICDTAWALLFLKKGTKPALPMK